MIGPMPPFVSCPGCGCAVKAREEGCPHCGMKLRGADGSVPRTAVALVLGLVSTVAACGDDTGTGGNAEGGFAADYGVPGTGGFGGAQ